MYRIILLTILASVYIASLFELQHPHALWPVYPVQIGLILLFKGALWLSPRTMVKHFFTNSLLVLALLVTTAAAHPGYLAVDQANEATSGLHTAEETGRQIGSLVNSGTLDTKQATAQIGEIFKDQPDQLETAKQAFQNELGEVKGQSVVRTVPVAENDWNCGELGCGYTDGYHTWTLSYTSRAVAATLSAVALGLLVWVNRSNGTLSST